MASLLIKYGSTALKEEVPFIMQRTLIISLLTMQGYYVNLLLSALTATSLLLEAAHALTSHMLGETKAF